MISNKTILRLKRALYSDGFEAIENFLGYEISEDLDGDALDDALDAVIDQMPEDTLQTFIEQYRVNEFVGIEIINRDVLSVTATTDFREALRHAITETWNFISDKKLQTFFDETGLEMSFRYLYTTFAEGNLHEREIRTRDGKFAFTVSPDDIIHCFCNYGGYQFDYFVKSPETL